MNEELEIELLGANIYANLGMPEKTYKPPKPMESKQILYAIRDKMIKWNNPDAKLALAKHVKYCARVDFALEKKELPLGSSKFGGEADLDKETLNSIIGDSNLKFLCQINLQQIRRLQLVQKRKGIYYFFFEENLESPSESKCKIHFDPKASINKEKFSTGHEASFYPIYTYPSIVSKVLRDIKTNYPEDIENCKNFLKLLEKNMQYYWFDTLFMAHPIPLQAEPFEQENENYTSLLQFAYRDPKYHIGIKESALTNLDFTEILLDGAST